MKIVNIHEAKTKLSALLAEVEATGEKVLICRHGKPVADLVPHRKRRRLEPHP
jgi:prevent-host-death family protein